MDKQNFIRQYCMTDNISDNLSGESRSNRDCRIIFKIVDDETKIFNFNQIVKNYHTYKPSVDIVGRSINWLVYNHDRIIGAIGIGSSVMAMKPRDDFIGWDKERRLKNLVNTATNWRFCLMEKGFGSQVLSKLLTESKKEWENKFGDSLVLLETLVEPPYQGTCYKANGWIYVGMTKGCQFEWKEKKDVLSTDQVIQRYFEIDGKRDDNKWKVMTGNNTPKYIFLKPLHRYWKNVLCH